MSKLYITLLISIAFCAQSWSQSKKDSLIAEGNRYFDKSHDYWDLTNLDSCFYYTSKALTSFKKASSDDDVVKCFNGLSSLSGYQGKFQKQKEFLDSALTYINEDSITINAVEANYNLASYLETIHLLEEAENRYLLTSKLAENLELDKLILHILHNNLSYLFLKLKNYKSAIDEIEIAINIIKEEKDLGFYHVRSLISKSNIYSEIGDNQEAFEALSFAKEIYDLEKKEEYKQLEYEILIEEAKVHFKSKQYAQCLDILAQCDSENLKKVSPSINLKYLSLQTLSEIKLSKFDLDNSEYLDDLLLFPNRNINNLQEYYGELAIMQTKNGDIQASRSSIKILIDEISKLKENMQSSNMAYQMAVLNQCAYQIKVGSEIDNLYTREQLNGICSDLFTAAYHLRRISYFSYVKTEWSEKIEELLPYMLNFAYKEMLTDDVIIDISELIKQRNANESTSLITKGKDSKIFKEVKNLEALIAKYEEHHLANNDEGLTEENRVTLGSLRNNLRSKIQSFKEEQPELYNSVYVEQIITISDIQSQLSDEDLVLTYLKSKEHLCVCSIDKVESSCKTTLIDASSDFEQLFALLENGQSSLAKYKTIATNIYQEYLEPYLQESKRRIILVPHGTLNFVPFHALVNNDGNFVLEDFSFNYQLNLSLLSSTSRRKQSIIKGVDVYIDEESKASALHCSEKEVSGIKQANVEVATDLKQLLNAHDKSKILHIIAHASSSNENLSGEISDGKSMLSGLRIKNGNIDSDLIILSSCESGIGVNTLGEGVSSLNSAIFHNDIGSSISSLWQIDDCSTSDILTTFYEHISCHSKDESLRKAMLNYIEEAHPSRRHPYFWAGLVQYGNSDVVKFETSNFTLILYGLLFLGFILLMFWVYFRYRKV